MKKRYTYFVLLLFVVLAISCNDDFLERPPLSDLTDDNFWQTEQQMKGAANACYVALIGKDVVNYGELLGDNTMWYTLSSWRQIGSGLYGSDLGTLNSRWVAVYKHLRRCNYFLENYQRATSVAPEKREQYAGEVKFLRAFLFFYQTSFWGDVPYTTKVLDTGSEELYGPRTPRLEIIKQLLDDLDDAATILPAHIEPASGNFGRISGAAAMALKARIALQNAPLYPEENLYDVAIAACERLMPGGDLAYHELYSTNNPEQDYFDLFTFGARASRVASNKETILAYVFNSDLPSTSRTYHNLSRELMVPDQIIRFNATKSMVDSYLCDDGLPIEKSPRYKGNGSYTPTYSAYDSLFVNRDPRLKQSFVYPGYDKWYGAEDGRGTEAVSTRIFRSPKFNNDGKGATTLTGFYIRKYCEPTKVPIYNRDDNDIVILRYGEVLLNYAEALFYKQGNTLTQGQIDATVNQLRDRVGMKRMILSELTANNMDLETELRRERRVEMFMEGLRWFDIVRWKEGYRLGVDKAETPERQEIGLIKGIHRSYAYDQKQIEGRNFDSNGFLIFDNTRVFSNPKNYLFSLPYTQMELNPNLKPNNQGWD